VIPGVDPGALRIARRVAREAMASGARAVVLTGSHAAGGAHAESDIDLLLIGRGVDYELSRRGRFLLSIEWRAAAACRRSLRTPDAVGAAVPGWRDAVIIEDPRGVAAGLQKRARAFTWDSISDDCDRWVAEQVTGFAEEVQKLVAALDRGAAHADAVWRSVMALRLAPVMAVHRRILYGSENVLWDLVSKGMGEPWASAQSRALAEHRETLEASCRAALELYALAAGECWPLLDRRQREVVGHACGIAGHPLTS